MNHSHDLPPELLETASVLEHHRPSLTEPELAAIKQRAAGPVSRRSTKQGGFMRSRLAIMALLATGALMSSGGAALGVSALSTDLTASSAQYGAPAGQAVAPETGAATAPSGGEVLGTQAQSAAPSGNTGTGDVSGVAGARTGSTPSATAAGLGVDRRRAAVHGLRGDPAALLRAPAARLRPRAAAQLAAHRAAVDSVQFWGRRAVSARLFHAWGSFVASRRCARKTSGSSGFRRCAIRSSGRGSRPAAARTSASP